MNPPAKVKRKTQPYRNVKIVSFGAYPEEIARWKAAAQTSERTLSWWIRNRLLAADAKEAEVPAVAKA